MGRVEEIYEPDNESLAAITRFLKLATEGRVYSLVLQGRGNLKEFNAFSALAVFPDGYTFCHLKNRKESFEASSFINGGSLGKVLGCVIPSEYLGEFPDDFSLRRSWRKKKGGCLPQW